MKTYTLTIIDSEGEIVLDRDLTPEEVIQMLLDERSRKAAEPEEVELKDEVAEPEKQKKSKKRGGRKPGTVYNCSLCKRPGHTAKTCKNNKLSAFHLDEDDKQTTKQKALEAHKQKVKRLVDSGASESEIYATMHDFMTDAEFREALEEARA